MCEGERVQGGRVIPNAPSDFPERKQLPHTPPPWVKPGEVFFITICASHRGTHQLATALAFETTRNALEHYREGGKLWPHLLLVMPDHLHLLVSFPPTSRMTELIRSLKRFVAKSAAISWQDGFFDHRLRTSESFDEKAAYIRMNPVRAGLVNSVVDWPFVHAFDQDTAR
jgi:putative transposase